MSKNLFLAIITSIIAVSAFFSLLAKFHATFEKYFESYDFFIQIIIIFCCVFYVVYNENRHKKDKLLLKKEIEKTTEEYFNTKIKEVNTSVNQLTINVQNLGKLVNVLERAVGIMNVKSNNYFSTKL